VQWTAVSGIAVAELGRVVGPRRQVLVLPNGIDVAGWRVARPPRPPGRVLVVAAMRLAPRKRPLPLLRMLRATRRRLSTVDLQAVVVGEGRQRGTLERYLRAHRMGDWVRLPGRLPRAEIRSLYEQADLFVAPAVLESFGIAALEARCAGLPVLARTGGGIGEFVGHGRHGLLAGSDAEMVRALVRPGADPAERERLAAASRQAPPRWAGPTCSTGPRRRTRPPTRWSDGRAPSPATDPRPRRVCRALTRGCVRCAAARPPAACG
jgi:glycosyltransferase involved in cell wall biosynthesis